MPSHASQVIGVIDCAGPHNDEDASIVALHYQHPRDGPPTSEEATRIAAANKYVRWTNVENLSLLGRGVELCASLLSIIQIKIFGPCVASFASLAADIGFESYSLPGHLLPA